MAAHATQRMNFPGMSAIRAPCASRMSRSSRVKVIASSERPLRVMISGAPAAGKGTQCAKIIEKYGLVHISPGDLLREERRKKSDIGKKAESYMDKGLLVPDEVVVEMVKNRLASKDVQDNGWLLDGYPRSATQAEAIEKENIRPDVFLLIDVPTEILVERVVGRCTDKETKEIYHMKFKPPPPERKEFLEFRSDDTEEAIKQRVATHLSNVDAVVGYYTDVLVKLDGDRPMPEVFANVSAALDAAKARIDPLEVFCESAPDADECRVYE